MLGLALSFSTANLAFSQEIQLVSPAGSASTEGPYATSAPFDISNGGGFLNGISPITSMRYQQIYPAADFSAFASGGEWITAIAFRPDANTGTGKAFSSTLPDIQIDFSTTQVAPAAMNSNFADNVGSNDEVVFARGSLSLSSADSGSAAGPKDFDIVIQLTTPFFYDPAAGNLLMDVRNYGAGLTTSFDEAHGGEGAFTNTGGDVNSATANAVDDFVLVTQFTAEQSIPEPEETQLIPAMAGLLLGFSRLRLARRLR